MRRMAGDGQNEIVMRRVHLIDIGARSPPDSARSRAVAAGSAPGSGVKQPPAVAKERGKARTRPGMLGPRHRVAGDEMDALGQMRGDRGDHLLLHRAHIGDRRAGREMRCDLGGDRPHRTHRHGQHHQIGPHDRLGGGRHAPYRRSRFPTRPRGSRRCGHGPRWCPCKPCAPHGMGHGRGDQPEPDQRDLRIGPAMVTLSRRTALRMPQLRLCLCPALAALELADGMGHAAAGGLVAHGDAQAMRQTVARHAPHDQTLGLEEGIAGLGLGRIGETGEDEIRGRGVGRHAKLGQSLGQPAAHPGIFGPAAGDMILIAHGGLGRFQLRGRQVEGPADPVQDVDDLLRAIAPADPQPAKAVDLGEGARHHHVRARLDQRGAAVIALHIFGIGPVEHQDRLRRQPLGQPRDLGQPDHRAGRVVGIGDEDQPRLLGAGGKDRIDIGRPLPLGHLHRGGPDREGGDRYIRKPCSVTSPRRPGRHRPGRGR